MMTHLLVLKRVHQLSSSSSLNFLSRCTTKYGDMLCPDHELWRYIQHGQEARTNSRSVSNFCILKFGYKKNVLNHLTQSECPKKTSLILALGSTDHETIFNVSLACEEAKMEVQARYKKIPPSTFGINSQSEAPIFVDASLDIMYSSSSIAQNREEDLLNYCVYTQSTIPSNVTLSLSVTP
jgi:hypothetical protein